MAFSETLSNEISSSEYDEDPTELKELADTLMLDLRASQRECLPSLNTAIFVLRSAHSNGSLRSGPHIALLVRLLLIRFNCTGASSDLANAVSINRAAYSKWMLSRPPMEDDASDEASMAEDLYHEFQHSVELSSVEQVVFLYNRAIGLLPDLHPEKETFLWVLSESLILRFHTRIHEGDLNSALSTQREMLTLLPPPNPHRHRVLLALTATLTFRLLLKFDFAAWAEAQGIYAMADEEDAQAMAYIRTGNIHYEELERTHDRNTMDLAVREYTFSLDLTPPSHPLRHRALIRLALCLLVGAKGDESMRAMALDYSRQALAVLPHTHVLRESALSLHGEIMGSKPISDVTTTILSKSMTVEQKETRFMDQLHELNEVVDITQEWLDLTASGGRPRYKMLTRLGDAFYLRSQSPFAATEDSDLEAALSAQRRAVDILKAMDSSATDDDWLYSLMSLGMVHHFRFVRTRNMADLEESATKYRQALGYKSQDPHRLIATRLNMAVALFERFSYNRVTRDLEEAITLTREALVVTRQVSADSNSSWLSRTLDLNRAILLKTLGKLLHARFHHLGEPSDIEEAVHFLRQSLAADETHSTKTQLYRALFARYRLSKAAVDLGDALQLVKTADRLSEYPTEGHEDPKFIAEASSIGAVLFDIYRSTGSLVHREEARKLCRQAAESSAAGRARQIENMILWAQASEYGSEEALEAYSRAIEILPQVAAVNLDMHSRQDLLRITPGLASDAAFCAVEAGQPEKAVEFLSAGRTVFWAQSLRLREPLDDLHTVAPALADRLRSASNALENASLRDLSSLPLLDPASEQLREMESDSAQRRRLMEDWEEVVNEVRNTVPGFDDFIRPQRFDQLRQCAASGPVIVLLTRRPDNVTTLTPRPACCALIITTMGVRHLYLPNVTHRQLEAMAESVQIASRSRGAWSVSLRDQEALHELFKDLPAQTRLKAHRVPAQSRSPSLINPLKLILENLWLSVVKPIINHLELTVTGSPQRLWWCPTGPFAFLPIHAAGIYGEDGADCLSDYAISSYTPSLDTLLKTPPSPSPAPNDFRMVTIIQAQTAGQVHLPSTAEELRYIRAHVSPNALTVIGDELSSPATVDVVLSELETAAFAHFACHGTQDPINPLGSALILSDGNLNVSTVMKTPTPRASLAFLSACETAKGDDRTPDEALHMAATLLFAGFGGVIGTMWSIWDEDAPVMADAFYAYMFRHGHNTEPDPKDAAVALQLAVKKLRARPGISLERWVPFMHLGV